MGGKGVGGRSGGENFPEGLKGHVEVGGVWGGLDGRTDYDAWVDGGDGKGWLRDGGDV